jgi:DNA-binding NarL/FixJ family response regulator
MSDHIKKNITILLADDHPLVRRGIRELLTGADDKEANIEFSLYQNPNAKK